MGAPYHHSLGVVTILLMWCLGLATTLQLLEVTVPRYKIRGEPATLTCHYNLQQHNLYSLKWYKGDRQFYQYIPGNHNPKSTFLVPGVDVDMGVSNEASVVLRAVGLGASGRYRCEVITEGPPFITRFGEASMTVIDLPESAPVLDGVKGSYHLGERVEVNCTSPYSSPAAALEWQLNDEPANPSLLRPYAPQQEADGLETSVLGLSFLASRKHFPRGELRIKCVAKIATLYLVSQETSSIETGFAQHTSKQGERLAGLGGSGRVEAHTTWLLICLGLLLS